MEWKRGAPTEDGQYWILDHNNSILTQMTVFKIDDEDFFVGQEYDDYPLDHDRDRLTDENVLAHYGPFKPKKVPVEFTNGTAISFWGNGKIERL